LNIGMPNTAALRRTDVLFFTFDAFFKTSREGLRLAGTFFFLFTCHPSGTVAGVSLRQQALRVVELLANELGRLIANREGATSVTTSLVSLPASTGCAETTSRR
jgi:hypothetical protein